MYDPKNHVLSVHHTSQKTGKVDGKKRIANQKEKRVQGAMKTKSSKRRFLLWINRENKQKAWKAQEHVHKTLQDITSLRIEIYLIELMMKIREKQKFRRNL